MPPQGHRYFIVVFQMPHSKRTPWNGHFCNSYSGCGCLVSFSFSVFIYSWSPLTEALRWTLEMHWKVKTNEVKANAERWNLFFLFYKSNMTTKGQNTCTEWRDNYFRQIRQMKLNIYCRLCVNVFESHTFFSFFFQQKVWKERDFTWKQKE